jgi:hypothetical protein
MVKEKNGVGFSNAILSHHKKIKNIEDIRNIEEEIKKQTGNQANILSFQLL